MSDIKFVGEDIHIEGNVQKVTCFDIELDNAGRRSNGAGRRRAFVHDFQDGLTLNWDRDYPGGVTINGPVKIPHGATVGLLQGVELKCTHHTLHLDHAAHRSGGLVVTGTTTIGSKSAAARKSAKSAKASSALISPGQIGVIDSIVIPPGLRLKRRALMHDANDALVVNVSGDYPGGVTIHGAVRLPGSLTVNNQNLLALITDLQAKVAALEARVATLETPPAG